ncbi:MAG: hypothetical protein ABSH13_06755 [Candidatus Acidiferrum sp.]|jgi:hypothetical protein
MDKKIFLTLILLLGTMFALKSARDAHRYSVLANNARVAHARNQSQHADVLTKADPSTVQTPVLHASFRPLNFALLRGGFSSVDEFFERVHDDPVLHSFYGDCADRGASMHALPEDITAFTTFRKGDKIKWSQKPLLIKRGEYVMTFCGKTVLARCGNLISFAPMQPSEDVPPAVLEAPSEPVETPLILEASSAGPAPVIPPAAAVPVANANSHRFFFIPPFYVPPGGSHSTPPPPAVIVPPPATVTPPPSGSTPPPPPSGTPPPPPVTPPPPPITTAPPPPPPGPPAPPAGHISGDEFSGHQALFTLLIGLFVIALLKLTTR